MSTPTNARNARLQRRTGFTLWELTMVLLIMGIAATLAAPALARSARNSRLAARTR